MRKNPQSLVGCSRFPGLESLEARLLLSVDAGLSVSEILSADMIQALTGTVCFDPAPVLPAEQTVAGADATLAATVPLSSIPLLHSNPSAAQKVYLDFDGQTVSGTPWNSYNGGRPIHAPAYDQDGDIFSFSDGELANIRAIWERVSEDYRPFNLDVTTEEPAATAFTAGSMAQRVLISTDVDDARLGGTGAVWPGGTYGGIAYYNTWSGKSDIPCWVFYNHLGSGNEKYTAEAASHEAGHTFGLSHDGTTTGTEYYAGQGSGVTGWAPIMGVGYYQNLTEWSKGEYLNANNHQDDLAVIASGGNKVTFRTDDYGNVFGAAAFLSPTGNSVSAAGIISTRGDVDVFYVLTDTGTLHFRVDPFTRGPNLDILAQLYDGSGGLLAWSNPVDNLYADISIAVPGGTYYLTIDGTGKGDPLQTGYTDYGSLGQYAIAGTIVTPGNFVAAPSNLAATAVSTTQVNLTWQDNSSNEDGFGIDRSTDGGTTWSALASVPADTMSYQDFAVTAGVTYTYRVYATSGASVSGYSNIAQVTTIPAAPATASAAAVSYTQIDVTWSNVVGETSFKIERSPNGADSWLQAGTVAANVTTFRDSGLKSGTTYYYRVFAVNAAGTSAPSPVASATTQVLMAPAAPTNLRITSSTKNSVRLAWTDNSGNESGFRIERSTNGTTWSQIATVGANVTSYTNNGLKRRTTYYYRVRAYNAAGNSNYTNVVSLSMPAPVGASASAGVGDPADMLVGGDPWSFLTGGSGKRARHRWIG